MVIAVAAIVVTRVLTVVVIAVVAIVVTGVLTVVVIAVAAIVVTGVLTVVVIAAVAIVVTGVLTVVVTAVVAIVVTRVNKIPAPLSTRAFSDLTRMSKYPLIYITADFFLFYFSELWQSVLFEMSFFFFVSFFLFFLSFFVFVLLRICFRTSGSFNVNPSSACACVLI